MMLGNLIAFCIGAVAGGIVCEVISVKDKKQEEKTLSAVYTVNTNMKFKDEEGAVYALRDYILAHHGKDCIFSNFDQLDLNTIDGCMKAFLTTQDFVKIDDGVYSSGFNATYGWGHILNKMCVLLEPYLEDGSEIAITMENTACTFYYKNGKMKWR